MPITDVQRKRRRMHIGSSDSPRILGVSPWGGPGDVFHEKVHDLPETKETPAMMAGNLLEGVILDWAAGELGVKIVKNQQRISHGEDKGILAAQFDALVQGKPEGMEAKYTTATDDWGEEGTDQIPDHVLVQCQHQAYVGDLTVVWVPVLMLRQRAQFKLYCVRRHEDLIRNIVERDVAFWREHVEPKVPPDGAGIPPMSILKSMARVSQTVALGDEALSWIVALEVAKADIKAAEEREEESKRTLIALLGEADGGKLPDGRLITYLEQPSNPSVAFKRLRAQHPEIFNEFVTQGSHRVLRIKKAPKAKGAK